MNDSGKRINPAGLIDLVGDQLSAEIEKYTQAESPTAGDDHELVLAHQSGVVDVMDLDGLLALATSRNCRIAIVPRLGDFVPLPLRLPECNGATPQCDMTWATRCVDTW